MWKAVLGAALSLVASVLVFQLQQGGVRRRRRRNVKEELDLLSLTVPGSWEYLVIRRRAARAMRLYVPRPGDWIPWRAYGWWFAITLTSDLAALTIGVALFDFHLLGVVVISGAYLGTAIAGMQVIFLRHRALARRDATDPEGLGESSLLES